MDFFPKNNIRKNKKINKISFFKPIQLNTSKSVKKIPLKNLTWPQARMRYPRMNPFGDRDKDGKLNMFDCKPFDKKRHSKLMRDEIARRLGMQNANEYKKTKKQLNKILPDYLTEGFSQKGKVITEKDVIKHFEKHPEQLKDIKNIDFAIMHPRNARSDKGGIILGRYEPPNTSFDKHSILLSPVMSKKEHVGKTITHELQHYKQQSKLDDPSSFKASDDLSREEYLQDPDEIEAREVASNLKRIKIEEKPETLQHFKGPQREIKESDSANLLRRRRGLNKIKTIDAAEFKKKYEETHGEKLDWNPDRLKTALDRNEDDAYPEVSFETSNVSDGRHRITAAALRGQKIDVAYPDWQDENNESSDKTAEEDKSAQELIDED